MESNKPTSSTEHQSAMNDRPEASDNTKLDMTDQPTTSNKTQLDMTDQPTTSKKTQLDMTDQPTTSNKAQLDMTDQPTTSNEAQLGTMDQPTTFTSNDSNLPRFIVTKWKAKALWSWQLVIPDYCAICRNRLEDPCIECQANQEEDEQECSVSWGHCEHAFHTHCISRWLLHKNVCPLDNKYWECVQVGK